MKRIINIKPILAVITIAMFAMVFKACKKADSNGNEIISADAKKEKLLQQIRKEYGGDVSASFVTPINKKADDVFYKDKSGNMQSLYGEGIANRPPQGCQYNCFNTSNPADLAYINYSLDYAERYYICESHTTYPELRKSHVRVKWTVTLPTTPELIAGTNNTSNTYCTVKFTNTSTSATQTFTISAANMQGKALGQLFNCTNGYLYEITGSAMEIPDTYFQSNWVVSAQLSLDIYCPVLGYVTQSSFIDGPSFSQNGYLPCNRVDKVWIDHGGTGPWAALGMGVAVCTQPSGFQYIDKHQFEYRKVDNPNSFEWADQSTTVEIGWLQNTTTPTSTFTLNQYVTLHGITATGGSDWWLFRYRNIKTGTCNEITGINASWPDGLWVTERFQY